MGPLSLPIRWKSSPNYWFIQEKFEQLYHRAFIQLMNFPINSSSLLIKADYPLQSKIRHAGFLFLMGLYQILEMHDKLTGCLPWLLSLVGSIHLCFCSEMIISGQPSFVPSASISRTSEKSLHERAECFSLCSSAGFNWGSSSYICSCISSQKTACWNSNSSSTPIWCFWATNAQYSSVSSQ